MEGNTINQHQPMPKSHPNKNINNHRQTGTKNSNGNILKSVLPIRKYNFIKVKELYLLKMRDQMREHMLNNYMHRERRKNRQHGNYVSRDFHMENQDTGRQSMQQNGSYQQEKYNIEQPINVQQYEQWLEGQQNNQDMDRNNIVYSQIQRLPIINIKPSFNKNTSTTKDKTNKKFGNITKPSHQESINNSNRMHVTNNSFKMMKERSKQNYKYVQLINNRTIDVNAPSSIPARTHQHTLSNCDPGNFDHAGVEDQWGDQGCHASIRS